MTNEFFNLAIDIGGTFTDTALAIPGQTQLITAKNPTTPQDPTRGALQGIDVALKKAKLGIGMGRAQLSAELN